MANIHQRPGGILHSVRLHVIGIVVSGDVLANPKLKTVHARVHSQNPLHFRISVRYRG